MSQSVQASPTRPAASTGTRVQSQSGFGPLIKNAWYVIADRSHVGRELRQITVLNEPLVYYRSEDGAPIVLDDRCAHRRFSLAKSHLKGDSIQCAYHGFTCDKTGKCIFANPDHKWRRAQEGFSGRLVVGHGLDQIGVGTRSSFASLIGHASAGQQAEQTRTARAVLMDMIPEVAKSGCVLSDSRAGVESGPGGLDIEEENSLWFGAVIEKV